MAVMPNVRFLRSRNSGIGAKKRREPAARSVELTPQVPALPQSKVAQAASHFRDYMVPDSCEPVTRKPVHPDPAALMLELVLSQKSAASAKNEPATLAVWPVTPP